MEAWSLTRDPTVRSFGFKLLLLAGTVGGLSVAGGLERPFSSAPPEALSMRQVEVSPQHRPQSSTSTVADAGYVNINRGLEDDLRRLPGIGPVLAERIIRHRREHGDFESIRDIQNVKGIGAKKFAQLEPYIHIDGNARSSDK